MSRPVVFSFGICLPALCLTGILLSPAYPMEFVWTRTTGQYRAEATPLIADVDGDGIDEIVAVNLGGQVMVWTLDGSPVGRGQDGILLAQTQRGLVRFQFSFRLIPLTPCSVWAIVPARSPASTATVWLSGWLTCNSDHAGLFSKPTRTPMEALSS